MSIKFVGMKISQKQGTVALYSTGPVTTKTAMQMELMRLKVVVTHMLILRCEMLKTLLENLLLLWKIQSQLDGKILL